MPPKDLLVEAHADGTVRDLAEAVAKFCGLPESGGYGLIRTMVKTRTDEIVRYLPDDLELAECGLLDGVSLTLADRAVRPAPELSIDRARRGDDLYLIDERGTHRGRVTRLADGEPVLVGRNPPDDGIGRVVFIDDAVAEPHALTLTNEGGQLVRYGLLQKENVYLAGTPASEHRGPLLPGSTISFREGSTDLATFVIATAAALHGRSPVGRVQYDVTARRSIPGYPELSEQAARVKQRPSKPDPRRFTWEFVAVSAAMAGVLYLTTHNALSLLSVLTAAVPIITYLRQRKQDRERYAAEHTTWATSLSETSAALTKSVGEEEKNLQAENPAPEAWAVRAYRRLAGLWERDPSEKDFLSVRLGLGELLSRYESRIEGELDLRDDPDFQQVIVASSPREVGRDTVRPKLIDAPVVVDLRGHHLGLAGPLHVVNAAATDLLLQVACAQPPGTVGIAALLPASPMAREPYDWLKWLPHTRSGSTLLPSTRMLAGREPCAAFLLEMQELHAERRAHRANEEPDSYALLVVHEAAEVDLGLLSEVCDLADGLVRVMWLGSSKDTAPKLVTCVVEVSDGHGDSAARTRAGSTAGQDSMRAGNWAWGHFVSGPEKYAGLTFDLDLFRVAPQNTVRALAGLYDPRSSGANAGVPQSVPLAAVMDLEHVTYRVRPALALAERFPIPIGVGEAGTLDLDLIAQGPHVLIGGTTGSGKSELLQTLTCGVISRYSPNEVSLFLVDFKGGATFAPFKDLPHVVGYITDLDQLNVNRALEFLRAELRRREERFQEMGDAKEYRDYLKQALASGRDDILPRLVVMFDEFATIVQDFSKDTIAAVVDIARRGRSWGVHLIMATQQPTRDVVVPAVRGNVNARIALRTPSPDESQTIIDRPDAAHIPQSIPGRALMTLGGNRLVEFQTAFAGAPFVPAEQRARVLVSRFDITALAATPASGKAAREQDRDDDEDLAAEADSAETDTLETSTAETEAADEAEKPEKQLEALAATVAGLGWGRSPGARKLPDALEEIPGRPALQDQRDGPAPSPAILRLGLRDRPKKQTQDDLVVDLNRGGLCIVGPNRSGTTTALVTAAEAFASQLPQDARASVICIDSADRLREELTGRFDNVIALPVTRLDQVTRVIDQLWERIQARMVRGADATDGQRGGPVILLLIDGCDRLLAGLGGNRALQWAARLADIMALGRRVGIYACVTAKRLRDLDNSVLSSQAAIITLHGQHENLGTPQEARLPGFGLDADGNLVQIYLPREPDGDRITLDSRLAAAFDPDGWRHADRTPPALAGTPDSDRGIAVGLGVDELFHRTVPVWLAESNLMIIGGPRSGRTRLLLTLADQVRAQTGYPVAMIAPRGLSSGVPTDSVFLLTGPQLSDIKSAPASEQAARLAGLGASSLKDGRLLLLVDDLQAITSMERGDLAANAIAEFYKRSLIQVIAAVTPTSTGEGVGREMKSGGTAVYVRPKADPSEYDIGSKARGMALRHRPDMVYQPGDIIIQTDERQLIAHMPELREATPSR